jgi:hypothetical protein
MLKTMELPKKANILTKELLEVAIILQLTRLGALVIAQMLL